MASFADQSGGRRLRAAALWWAGWCAASTLVAGCAGDGDRGVKGDGVRAVAGSPGAVAGPGAVIGSAVNSDAGTGGGGLQAGAVGVRAEPWRVNGPDGREVISGRVLRSANVVVHTSVANEATAAKLPVLLEAALAMHRTALGPLPAPPGPLECYVFSDRAQWKPLAQAILSGTTSSSTVERIQAGGFTTGGRAFLFDIGPQRTLQLAAHEAWHQYTQRTFREPMPVWLEEGVATFMEGYRWQGDSPVFSPWANTERFDQLRAAASAERLMPLEMLLSVSPQEVLGVTDDAGVTYYAQLWALVHWLNEGEGGRHAGALRQMVADAAMGRMSRRMTERFGLDGPSGGGGGGSGARRTLLLAASNGTAVFREYIDRDVAGAAEGYRRFVMRLVESNARGAIVAGRSPLAGGAEAGGAGAAGGRRAGPVR